MFKVKNPSPGEIAIYAVASVLATITTALLAYALIVAFINTPILAWLMLALVLVMFIIAFEMLRRVRAEIADARERYEAFNKVAEANARRANQEDAR